MDKVSSRAGWEMLSGYHSCTCTTDPEQLPNELRPGVLAACSHLYVKKSAVRDIFHISISPVTSVGSSASSPVDSERPQGIRVLRGGPLTIVIHPTPPRSTKELPRPAGQTGPTFASLADERAADDLGVLLMGGVSCGNSPPNSRKRIVRPCRRTLPSRSSRSSSANSRCRKPNACHSLRLKMPSRAFEVDIKLDKVPKDPTAGSPDQLAGRTDMVGDANGDKENSIRCNKHTISSLLSSRIGDMNRETRMLQESECKRKGAHRPHRPPPSTRITRFAAGSMRCLYDSFSKRLKPRQFTFHGQ